MRKILSVLVAIVALLAIFVNPAQAKSFTIEKLVVEARLNADASMDVTEHLTYDFIGSFSEGTRPIPKGDYYRIVDMRVSEAGQALPSSGAPDDLKWNFSATNEKRTFGISYKVMGAARVGPDVGELYWQFMGKEHPGFGSVDVTLTTPSADGLRAWAHGPLHGVVSLNGNVVNMNVVRLPSNTFVEGRVTLPSSVFTVAPSGGERLPGILKEEKTNADVANAQRGFTEKPPAKRYPTLFNVFSAVGIALAIVAHVLIWKKWGREPKRPADVGKYWYEAPEVAPATVIATLGEGDGFAGTLVDLAQRGYLTIEEYEDESGLLSKVFGGKTDWRLKQQKPIDMDLQPFETRMLRYLFDDGAETTQSELHKRAEKHPTKAKAFLDSFKAEVQASVEGEYWVKGTGKAIALNILLAVALFGLGIASALQTGYLGAAAIVVALVLGVLSKNMTRRTELGARKAAEWDGLKNYLKDFSNFKDAPIGHMILWERFLVFGVAFGVAEELARGFEARVPEVSDPSSNFAGWYSGSSGMHGVARVAALGSFGSGLSSALSPPSSSSGSGGGFSGGGGGGGGGGGAGAN